jgi:hypothetical protein
MMFYAGILEIKLLAIGNWLLANGNRLLVAQGKSIKKSLLSGKNYKKSNGYKFSHQHWKQIARSQ